MQSWNELNTPEIICMLLSKLPGSARDKWPQNVLTISIRGNKKLEMTDFIQFDNNETLLVTYPVFSKEAVQQHVEQKQSY